MKISTLIKKLQKIQSDRGNIEVFVAELPVNHYDASKDIQFYNEWYGKTNSKVGVLLGAEREDL